MEGFIQMEMITRTETTEQQAANAALAALAATGNRFALGQLWEINKGLLRRLFWKWYSQHQEAAEASGLTMEDLEQEGFLLSSMQRSITNLRRAAFQPPLQRRSANGSPTPCAGNTSAGWSMRTGGKSRYRQTP